MDVISIISGVVLIIVISCLCAASLFAFIYADNMVGLIKYAITTGILGVVLFLLCKLIKFSN